MRYRTRAAWHRQARSRRGHDPVQSIFIASMIPRKCSATSLEIVAAALRMDSADSIRSNSTGVRRARKYSQIAWRMISGGKR
jgi:hypothetical protein